MLYPTLYIAVIASLALWFLYRSDEEREHWLQRIFFGLFLAYFAVVLTAEVKFGTKLWVLFRDLTAMALLGTVFQLATAKRTWFIGATVASAAFLAWFVPVQMSGSLSLPGMATVSYDPDGELLLELAEGVGQEVLGTAAYKYDLTFSPAFTVGQPDRTELDDYLLVNIPESHLTDLEDIMNDLRSVPEVDWVEPNEQVTINPVPAESRTDTRKNFGVNDPGITELWGFEAMGADGLYALLRKLQPKPAKTALIAILDTGVDANHEDLSGNYKSLNTSDDNDPRGHGTHCAGIAAAVTNNGLGIASFSPGTGYVQVTSIKVLNASGMGTQKSIINGMIKAADGGADVISMSLGGLSNQSKERAYRKAVEYANENGAIVVAAAGNANRNARNYVPAAVDGVISVSAVDQELRKAVFSNYVTDLKRGVAAPGVGIYSTIPGNQYDTYNGTSMATPYVAGLLGLMKSFKPGLTTDEAYRLLNTTGKATRQTEQTGRLIQPGQVMEQLLPAPKK
ncbi:MAG: S8 family serine peptidase [Phaeodactylibacter sp.]|uniref:S8 family serine peptidase n=1 Tax=Phaeodactylibacter sp. TaxID=1940289 RepID=UPI0032EE8823